MIDLIIVNMMRLMIHLEKFINLKFYLFRPHTCSKILIFPNFGSHVLDFLGLYKTMNLCQTIHYLDIRSYLMGRLYLQMKTIVSMTFFEIIQHKQINTESLGHLGSSD